MQSKQSLNRNDSNKKGKKFILNYKNFYNFLDLKRSQSSHGKELLAKKIQKINLDQIKLGKNQSFSLLEYRNNYLDQHGNFMPSKHLTFKIKLTENEYRLLIKEKMKYGK